MGDVIQIGRTSTTKPDTSEDQVSVTHAVDGTPIRFAEEPLCLLETSNAATQPVTSTEGQPEYVWTCILCACQCFQLLESGITVCVRCGHRSVDAPSDAATAWRTHLPDLPLNLEEIPPLTNANVIIDTKPVDLILAGFSKGVKTEDPVAVFMIRRDGSMRMWCEGVHNDEQEEWFRSRLDRVCDYILQRHEEPT